MPFRCPFDACWRSESIDYNVITRAEVQKHLEKKGKPRLLEFLKEHNVMNIDYSILSKWTIYNLVIDLSFTDNQEKLIQSKEDE